MGSVCACTVTVTSTSRLAATEACFTGGRGMANEGEIGLFRGWGENVKDVSRARSRQAKRLCEMSSSGAGRKGRRRKLGGSHGNVASERRRREPSPVVLVRDLIEGIREILRRGRSSAHGILLQETRDEGIDERGDVAGLLADRRSRGA